MVAFFLNGDSAEKRYAEDKPLVKLGVNFLQRVDPLLSLFCATTMPAPSVKSKGDQEEVASMDSDELQLVKKINHPATLRWPYLK